MTAKQKAGNGKSRAPFEPVRFEYVTDGKEDRVGLDMENVPQIADHTEAVKVRPRTFHQWLNGGRLVGALAQVKEAEIGKRR